MIRKPLLFGLGKLGVQTWLKLSMLDALKEESGKPDTFYVFDPKDGTLLSGNALPVLESFAHKWAEYEIKKLTGDDPFARRVRELLTARLVWLGGGMTDSEYHAVLSNVRYNTGNGPDIQWQSAHVFEKRDVNFSLAARLFDDEEMAERMLRELMVIQLSGLKDRLEVDWSHCPYYEIVGGQLQENEKAGVGYITEEEANDDLAIVRPAISLVKPGISLHVQELDTLEYQFEPKKDPRNSKNDNTLNSKRWFVVYKDCMES